MSLQQIFVHATDSANNKTENMFLSSRVRKFWMLDIRSL